MTDQQQRKLPSGHGSEVYILKYLRRGKGKSKTILKHLKRYVLRKFH